MMNFTESKIVRTICRNSGIFVFLTLLIIISSCSHNNRIHSGTDICGLATPVIFNTDTIRFFPGDYFTDPAQVADIEFPEGIHNVPAKDTDFLVLTRTKKLPPLSIIHMKARGRANYSLIVKNITDIEVTIEYRPKSQNVSSVKVKGSMNFWNPLLSKMKNIDGVWKETFRLTPGEYQYLLVVDGKEIRDPENPDIVDNNIGGFNSLLKVGKYKQEDLPFMHTTRINEDNSINIETDRELSAVYAFWQNTTARAFTEGNIIKVIIPEESAELKRSYIRVYACKEDGFANDILVPLEYGKVVTNTHELTRFDRQTMIIYFMMVDRFRDGDTDNDKPLKDPDVLPKVNYYGGDIQGIIHELDAGYFQNLGVNTLWISPIMQNPDSAYGLYPKPHTRFSAYHGYWPVYLTKIDHHFGTPAVFHALVNDAHADSMNVLLDYVAHHVHKLSPVYKQHPDWVTNLYLPDGTLNTEKWDEYRLTTWFDTFLPTLDLRKPEVVDPMTDSALFWVNNYHIDGFRHDATKHIDLLFWRTLNRKLKMATNCDPMVYQIGETYGSPDLIRQFDFNVYDDAVAVFARKSESTVRLKNSMEQSLRYYGYHNLMGYITGNQDRPRFISLAGGDLKFGEDTKLAGWTRNIGVGDSSGYNKLELLHAFNLTIPGIPVIYYGDEIGLPGGNDPDNRRWMKFSGLNRKEAEVKSVVERLTALRRSSMALQYGDIQFVNTNSSTLAYWRYYFDERVLVVLNKSGVEEKLKLAANIGPDEKWVAHFGHKVSFTSSGANVDLPAYSFEIISINKN